MTNLCEGCGGPLDTIPGQSHGACWACDFYNQKCPDEVWWEEQDALLSDPNNSANVPAPCPVCGPFPCDCLNLDIPF